jgi:hypothetical protein
MGTKQFYPQDKLLLYLTFLPLFTLIKAIHNNYKLKYYYIIK